MKVLVLGGSGFIGSHVVDVLLANGHFPTVYDRSAGVGYPLDERVQYVKGELSNRNMLSDVIASVDAVVHLISSTIPSTSNMDPLYDISSNLMDSVAVLQMMRFNRIQKIVYLSSGGTVYGVNNQSPIPENHSTFPVCSYGIVKLAFEKYLHMFHHLYGLNYISLRASNPYGPKQSHIGSQGVVGTMLSNVAAGNEIEIWGDGLTVRDFIYVDDLADLCVKALQSEEVGVFNAGSGVGISILDLVAYIESVLKLEVEKKYLEERRFDVRDNILDISNTRKKLGWSPNVSFEVGLKRTWDWIQREQIFESKHSKAA